MRCILPFLAMAVAGCSSSAPQDSPEELGSPVTTGVTNGIVNLPAGQWCTPQSISGYGAHSQATLLSRYGYSETPWLPNFGGQWWLNTGAPQLRAFPNTGPIFGIDYYSGGAQGSLSTNAYCQPWPSGSGLSGDYKIYASSGGWASQWTQNGVMWDDNSTCWIVGTAGQSYGGEDVWITRQYNPAVGNYNWRYNILAWQGIEARFACAWLGHPIGGTQPFTAYVGQPAQTTLSTSSYMCVLTRVMGNLDDGSVQIGQTNGFWSLQVDRGVQAAGMMCFAR